MRTNASRFHLRLTDNIGRKHLRQQGFSLIELLVALAIGLLIMASVLMIYAGASRTSRTSEMESQMNEDGLIALNIIQQQIRMAGYSGFENPETTDKPKFTGAGVIGCSAAAFYPNATVQPAFASLNSTDCDANSDFGDGIIVRYEADLRNTVPTDGSPPKPTNCLMNTASTATDSAGVPYFLPENRYFVAASGTNPPALYCAAGNQIQPMLDNVEKMGLLYGISATTTPGDTQVITYLNAADINTAFSGESMDTRWKRVVSVKTCLLMRSTTAMKDIAATATYRDCDGTLVTQATPDGYLRRAFISTATLRNRLTITDRNRKNES